MISDKKNLLLLNFRVDSNDEVLGFTTEWINSFSIYYENIFVITMYVGTLSVSKNVFVYSLQQESNSSSVKKIILFYKYLFTILFRNKVHFCFVHMAHRLAILVSPITRIFRIPTILWYAHKSVTFSLKIAVFLVDKVVSSSKSGIQIDSPKIKIIGQGINTDRFVDSGTITIANEFVIITVGRISKIKNLDIALHSLNVLRDQIPHAQFYIYGSPLTLDDRVYYASLTQLVVDLNLTKHVQFKGGVPNHKIHEIYNGAHCFLNVSDTDSVDKVVLEAMACGVPVVTTNNSFKEILPNWIAKDWVVEKGNVSMIAKKLLDIYKMDDSSRSFLRQELVSIVKNNHSLRLLSQKIYNSFLELEER